MLKSQRVANYIRTKQKKIKQKNKGKKENRIFSEKNGSGNNHGLSPETRKGSVVKMFVKKFFATGSERVKS